MNTKTEHLVSDLLGPSCRTSEDLPVPAIVFAFRLEFVVNPRFEEVAKELPKAIVYVPSAVMTVCRSSPFREQNRTFLKCDSHATHVVPQYHHVVRQVHRVFQKIKGSIRNEAPIVSFKTRDLWPERGEDAQVLHCRYYATLVIYYCEEKSSSAAL